MVGLSVVTNHELVSKINESFPEGIFSVESFLEKMLGDMIFYSVRLLPEVGFVSFQNFTLRSVNKKEKTCFLSKKWEYSEGYQTTEKKWYISDLLSSASGCFLSESDAKLYKEVLSGNKKKLIGLI